MFEFNIKINDLVKVKPTKKVCKVVDMPEPTDDMIDYLRNYWKERYDVELTDIEPVSVKFLGNNKIYVYPKSKVKRIWFLHSIRRNIWNKKHKQKIKKRICNENKIIEELLSDYREPWLND